MSGDFRFKRFLIRQGGSAMKVGTDGVLLGAWCGLDYGCSRALDIGSGTGVIAVMLAQRGEGFGLEVDAVELDSASSAQAEANIADCEWRERIKVFNCRVQDFAEKEAGRKYGLVVSNPPYFTDSLLPPDKARMSARHAVDLTFDELLRCASSLLDDSGRFSLILPYEQAGDFITRAAVYGLFPSRRTEVFTKPGQLPKRTLIELGRDEILKPENATLTIEGDGAYGFSEDYINLTRDFYLKF